MQSQQRRGGASRGGAKAAVAQAKASAEVAKRFWTALPLGQKCRVLHFEDPKLVERTYVIQQMLWYSELLCHRSGVRVRDGATDSRNLALEAFEFKWPTTRPRIPYQTGPHGQTSPVAFAVRAEFLQREDLLDHVSRVANGSASARVPRDEWPSVFEPTPNAWSDYERQVFKLVEVAILEAAAVAAAATAAAAASDTPEAPAVVQHALETVEETPEQLALLLSEETTPKKKARRKKKGGLASQVVSDSVRASGTGGAVAQSDSGCSVHEGHHGQIREGKKAAGDQAILETNEVNDEDEDEDAEANEEEQEEESGEEAEEAEEADEDEEEEEDEEDEEEEVDEEEGEEEEESDEEECDQENVDVAQVEAAPVAQEQIPCTAQEEADTSSSWEMVSRRRDRRARPAASPLLADASSSPFLPRSASGSALQAPDATSDAWEYCEAEKGGSSSPATLVSGHHADPLLGSGRSAASSEAPTAAPAHPSAGHSRQSSSSRASAASAASAGSTCTGGGSPLAGISGSASKPLPAWSPVWCPNGFANEEAEWHLQIPSSEVKAAQAAQAEEISELRAVVRRTFLDVEPVRVSSSHRRSRSLDRW